MPEELLKELQSLITEGRNPLSVRLDTMSTREILNTINREDAKVAAAVAKVIPEIEKAVELVVEAFLAGGRLFYIGAGTSGRLGVLDAAECPPTFGTDPELVQGFIAGGYGALVRAVEGAEDDAEGSHDFFTQQKLNARDCVCGIAASKRTPFVRGGLDFAKTLRAKTILVTCNPPTGTDDGLDVVIAPVVGPEILTGSTRMKAGTATKLVLNMLTTAAMVRMGKCYGNLMIDLRATSEKLRERARAMLMLLTGVSYSDAERLLHAAGGELKTAIAMQVLQIEVREARKRLTGAGGQLRAVIGNRLLMKE
ncbi:MAG: N-acetylmuramic acid 6-phosphate etherase [Calditrichaeota bacterium]|nr:N-acetylmuramic acid 6-phosphate etherase [Calditrichota bacterium]